MKELIVLIPFLGSLLGYYPSKFEARNACHAWREADNKTYISPANPSLNLPSRNIETRECRFELETNQILGVEFDVDEKGQRGDMHLRKHFRY